MKASDAMTPRVITTTPDASILEALRLMLQHKISGLPVVDAKGALVGMVTEGDFLRRAETKTERKRPHWMEFVASPDRLASEYVHAHGRKVAEVMTPTVFTVSEDTPLEDVVDLMERHRVKRLPVMRGDELVGIISRANLLHVLAGIAREVPAGPQSDDTIRKNVIAELDRQAWAPRHLIDVTVRNGVVELWGTIVAGCQSDAARVAAENVPGVKSVRSHLVWIEPMSGVVISDPDNEATAADPATDNAKRTSQRQAAN